MEERTVSIKEGSEISRRAFLGGLGATAALGAVASLTGCGQDSTAAVPATSEPVKWYGSAKDLASFAIAETIETEILICGAGHSGMIASLAAAEKGAKTLVVEKNQVHGVIRSYSGCIGSKAQNLVGETAHQDALDAVNELARYASNRANQRLIKVWADESGATWDWIADYFAKDGLTHVAEYDQGDPYHGIYKKGNTHTKFVDLKDPARVNYMNAAGVLGDLMYAHCCTAGAEFRFSTSLVQLIRSDGEQGQVTGAIAANSDGTYVQINASKGVFLCTGGYETDAELLAELNPAAASVTSFGMQQVGATGDGIKAGILAGGVKDADPTVMLFDRGNIMPGAVPGYPYTGQMNLMGSQPFLKVNLKGERFCNESAPYDFPIHASSIEKDHAWGSIWDSNWYSHAEAFHTIGCSRLVPSTSNPPTFEGLGLDATTAWNAKLLDAGFIVQADTLEELAQKLKLPVETFVATVQRYNELAAKGVDEDFGKPGKETLPLAAPPFFGAIFGAWLLCTLDGLAINVHGQVVDTNDEPIEGLYAAGNASGSFFANNYPELYVGVASGRAATMARHGVLHALGAL